MSDTRAPAAAEAREVSLSRRALKALGEVPGLRCGALSPLARITPPDAPADRAGLVDALTSLEGPRISAAPALLDPHRTVALLFGDGDTALIGQYLWPDADGRQPGFRAFVRTDAVRLAGPIAPDEVLRSCLDLAALSGVAEAEPLRMTFDLEQFWATLTLLDAYRIGLLRRRLSRQGGYPAGVSATGLAEAWTAGLAVIDPGWSVSLFALLRPDLVPAGFEARVVGVVDRMDAAGLLAKLSGEPDDPLGDVYIFGEGLDLLCQAVIRGVVQIGLAVERLRAPNEIELTTIGGWRTPGGFWLADLSEIPPGGTGTVVVTLLGPSYFAALVEGALGGGANADDGGHTQAASAPGSTDGPYSRDSLLGALRAVPTATGESAISASIPGWTATHAIPREGMTAWQTPDPRGPGVTLAGGLPVAIVQRVGDWARIVASNGWTGWVDGRRFG